MKKVFIVLVIFLSYGQIFSAEKPKESASLEKLSGSEGEDHQKLKYKIITTLMSNSDVSLQGKKTCNLFTQEGQNTVGKFMSWSLSFFDENISNFITVKCEKKKQTETCTVNFAADSKGESPWSCGLRFDRNSSEKIDFNTLECIGTC